MPRTTSGLKYRVGQRDESAFCIVCGTDDGQPTVEVLMQIPRVDDHKTYAFPVCSLLCLMAWTELLSRVNEGENEAMAIAVAYMAQHYAS